MGGHESRIYRAWPHGPGHGAPPASTPATKSASTTARPTRLKPLTDAGAKPMASIKAAATFGEAVFTMLADDAAVIDVVGQPGGLKESLPKGGIHICAGTHSVAAIAKLAADSRRGRTDPDRDARCSAALKSSPPAMPAWWSAGRTDAVERCRPLFDGDRRRASSKPAPSRSRRCRHQDRQQFRARLRHRGAGRGLLR